MHRPLARLLLAVGALALGSLLPVSAAEAAEPAAASAPAKPAAAATKPTADEAGSYSVGLMFASQWRDGGLLPRVSVNALMRGIRAGLDGKPLGPEDRGRASEFLKTAFQALAVRNQALADEFLARNGREPGVRTTSSGLQYQVLAAGPNSGRPAGPDDRITVQYRGHLLDGTVFDSSEAHGRPTVIRPAMVIQGWHEALALMPVGAKWRLFIPPALGYGTSPPPAIPPNSLLIFDLEVLQTEPVGGERPSGSR